jgi:hypothetical protein
LQDALPKVRTDVAAAVDPATVKPMNPTARHKSAAARDQRAADQQQQVQQNKHCPEATLARGGIDQLRVELLQEVAEQLKNSVGAAGCSSSVDGDSYIFVKYPEAADFLHTTD